VNTNELVRKIFLRVARFKWVIFIGAIIVAVVLYFYAKTIPQVYTAKTTVFPLTAANENPTTSAITTLLGGGDAPKSFSQDASINIVELALSRNTMDAVVLKRLPQFGNKRIAELLIESYNKTRKNFSPAIKATSDTAVLKAYGSALLKENYTAKVLKSGIFEVTFSNSSQELLSPVSYQLIDKISQFYIDMKIKKAKRDYDFTLKKVDSFQAVLDVYDRQAIRMNNTTLFVPNSKIEYSIPKENLVNAKERLIRLRDASANNREEALWRLQKATPIIATLDKPEPPFDVKRTSGAVYGFVGFFLGAVLTMVILIAPLLILYLKEEANKAIFGGEDPEETEEKNAAVTTTA
jgi:uncharacterized protein involved in exopolysaccharide biosynthesis